MYLNNGLSTLSFFAPGVSENRSCVLMFVFVCLLRTYAFVDRSVHHSTNQSNLVSLTVSLSSAHIIVIVIQCFSGCCFLFTSISAVTHFRTLLFNIYINIAQTGCECAPRNIAAVAATARPHHIPSHSGNPDGSMLTSCQPHCIFFVFRHSTDSPPFFFLHSSEGSVCVYRLWFYVVVVVSYWFACSSFIPLRFDSLVCSGTSMPDFVSLCVCRLNSYETMMENILHKTGNSYGYEMHLTDAFVRLCCVCVYSLINNIVVGIERFV